MQSVIFSIKERVGSLKNCLDTFYNNKVNLTKITSRPSRMNGCIDFYVNFDKIDKSTLNKIQNELINQNKVEYIQIKGDENSKTNINI
jgi:prephenate dehydratase